jgi:hypothetical protein
MTVDAVAARLEGLHGERPDIADFVLGLLDTGLVEAVDGAAVAATAPGADACEAPAQPARPERLRAEHVRWLFGRPALAVHASALVAAFALLALHPRFIPTSANLHVHPWYALSTLLGVGLSLPLMALHELGHMAAARAKGIDGRFTIGRVLDQWAAMFVLGDVWSATREGRLVVYLAGMIVNAWVFLVGLVVLVLWGPALPVFVAALIQLVLLLEWYLTAWQLRFYMRTDLYFVVAEAFRARNLMADAQAFLLFAASRLVGRHASDPLAAHPRRERTVVRWYSVFYLAGVAVTLALFAYYVLPFVIDAMASALRTLSAPRQASPAALADALVTLTIYGVNFGLLLWLWWRDTWEPRFRRLRGWLAARSVAA